jgi:hypothetical protein
VGLAVIPLSHQGVSKHFADEVAVARQPGQRARAVAPGSAQKHAKFCCQGLTYPHNLSSAENPTYPEVETVKNPRFMC